LHTAGAEEHTQATMSGHHDVSTVQEILQPTQECDQDEPFYDDVIESTGLYVGTTCTTVGQPGLFHKKDDIFGQS